MHAALELPLEPLDLPGEMAFCRLLRDRAKAREDALAAMRFVDRTPARDHRS